MTCQERSKTTAHLQRACRGDFVAVIFSMERQCGNRRKRNFFSRRAGIALLAIGMLLPVLAYSQKISSHDKLFAGLYLGYGGAFYSGNFDVFQGGSACGTFTTGGGWEPQLGLCSEFPISQKFSLSPRFLWNDLSGAFTTTAPNTGDVMDNGYPTAANLQDKLTTTLHFATLDALLQYMPFKKNNYYVLGGATLGYNLAASFTQTESIVSPDNAVLQPTGHKAARSRRAITRPSINCNTRSRSAWGSISRFRKNCFFRRRCWHRSA